MTSGSSRSEGDKLVAMFERASLGLKPKQTFELDPGFFDAFMRSGLRPPAPRERML